MIQFAALVVSAVSFKLLGSQIYTPLTVFVAGGLFFLRYAVDASLRTHIERFLLQFGVLLFALSNQDPSHLEHAALPFCMVPSVTRIRQVGRLALSEGTCLLLLACMVWSFAWTSDPGMTLAGVVMSIICLGFLFGYVLTFEGDMQVILRHVLQVLVVIAVSSLLVGGMGYGRVGLTFAGVTLHRNHLGLLLGLLILLCLFLVRTPPVWLRMLGVAGGAGFLAYIDSKSAIISVTVTATLWLIVNAKRWRLWCSLAVAAVAWLVLSLPSPKLDHFAMRMGRDPTFTGRTGIWEDSLQLLTEQPFTGFGYNAVWSAFENRLAQYPEAPGPLYAHAHNAWLDWGLQLGAGGLALYVIFLAVCLLRAVRTVRNGLAPHLGFQAVTLLAYVEIYNLANVSTVPITRFGFFILAVTTSCLFLRLEPHGDSRASLGSRGTPAPVTEAPG